MKREPVKSVSIKTVSAECGPLKHLPLKHLPLKHLPLKRVLQAGAAVLLPMALAAPAFAQQLLQPAAATVTQPAPVSGTGPRLKQPQPSVTDTVRSTPDARPTSPAIKATGPADETPDDKVRKPRPASQWAPVLNASGMPVDGFLQVAPNRVYDPARKVYHWTVPTGDQQKIVQ
ncbi:MAG: hypothetical protein ABIO17_03130 [Pseudoxanthomonas sp.]